MKDWIKAFALGVLIGLVAVALAALAGCAHAPIPGPPPPPPPMEYSPAPCEGFVPEPTDDDVCEGRFTIDGLACVRCEVPIACLHGRHMVYCTPTCSDRECAFGAHE